MSSSLLASVSFDKRVGFYDLSTQKVVKTILTDYPLTACDFHNDGKLSALQLCLQA